ncbi:C-reactive protein-like [Rhineura floridana]|uniref:C-reactive protein-like n=1 Tax=Rhineura floridana TaxID=261503 RepID=UPI002AC8578F|nr:C-reactive protein-like [Rhineura floridana]
MRILHPFLLILAGQLGSLAQEDLDRKAFIFPVATDTARVVLKAHLQMQPLSAFTVCLRFQSELTRNYSLFSYASKVSNNEILIHYDNPNTYSLLMRGGIVTFNVTAKLASAIGKEHICLSWESATGLVDFWWNGQSLPRKLLMKGQSVTPDAFIILGQKQDSSGGDFDLNQSFVGEIEDVYMWDRELSSEEVCLVWDNRPADGSVIDWRALHYQIIGEVVVAPSTVSACRAECSCQTLRWPQ